MKVDKVNFSNRELYNYKYIPLLHNKKRYNFLMGGGGSGKSKFVAQKEIIKTFKKGNRLLAVRKVKDTMKDSVFAELKGVINDWNLQSYFDITTSPMKITNTLTGSDIIFRGLDDVEKIKSVQGVTRIWLEESTESVKADFDQLDIRLRGKGKELQLTCTYNPISDQHWLITDFWNYGSTDDVECVHSTYKDNRFVGQEQYDKVFARLKKQDPNLYKIYALGIPGKATEGLVYDYEIINEIPEDARLKGYGLDFGYNDPTALVAIYEYNADIIFHELLYKQHLNNADVVRMLKSLDIKESDEIIGDNARPEAIDEIFKSGFNCKPCRKGKDSIIHGIQLVKQYNLKVTSSSSNAIKELNNYTWAKDKNGKPLDNKTIDAFNHLLDALRYGVTNFFNKDDDLDIYFI